MNEKVREIARSINETVLVVLDNLFISISFVFDGGIASLPEGLRFLGK